MAQRTVLHIGLPKTGTTFLQTTMWEQRALLEQRGFHYPGSDRMDHFETARSVGGLPGPDGHSHRVRADLVDAARRWDGTVVLTHEFFSQATTAQAARFVEELGPTELVVVVTARDLVRQLPAVWQEALKMGNAGALGDFADRMLAPGHQAEVRAAHASEDVVGTPHRRAWGWSTQDLAAVLDRWGAAVGRERLRLVTVPQPGAPRSLLWERWCEVTGLDDEGLDHSLAFANESLGATQARLLTKVVQQLSPDFGDLPVRHRWLRQYFGHEVLVPQGGARIGLSEHHLQLLRPVTDAMLEEVAAGGYAVTGDLEELRSYTQSSAAVDPDTVDDSETLAVATRALEQMVVDVRGLSTASHGAAPPPPAPLPPPLPHRLRRALGRRARALRRRYRGASR
ncbi:hypothetical protein [Nocardioides aequoreus]|uniref:hypothetical protein n=1 Tax=Nocardioides aequoreus TaxID=397278 RepID=UPI0004C2FC0D|nr:hypothetical protein [Nocardioides aequoreus]